MFQMVQNGDIVILKNKKLVVLSCTWFALVVVITGFIQTDGELRYIVDSGVPFHVSYVFVAKFSEETKL